LHARAGRTAEAREDYETALRNDARNVTAANNLANMHAARSGGLDEALDLARTARRHAPEDPRVADTLGHILHRRGEHAEAAALLQEAVRRRPESPWSWYHLGLVRKSQGDVKGAREALEKALAVDATFPDAAAARKALSEL
jgi:Flp pilus assembly protein TadD